MIRDRIKWWLFPGLNLHARLRYRTLPRFFGSAKPGQQRTVLDAGCGNGMLSYQSYLRGNEVLGISIKEGEVARNTRLFNGVKGIPRESLRFELRNLYDLDKMGLKVDEIICTEVLEHISDDIGVCRRFFEALKPGGLLHLCCPNAEHPDHKRQHLDEGEAGGHVRCGYTLQTYKNLLEPIGFRIESCTGLGGPIRQAMNKRITNAQYTAGIVGGITIFLLTWPFHNTDGGSPLVPYSLYVQARKPAAVNLRSQ